MNATSILFVRILPVLALAWASTAAASSLDDAILRLADPDEAERAVEVIVRHGERAVPALVRNARAAPDVTVRGWAVVALGAIPGERVDEALGDLTSDTSLPDLVRTWAAAARIRRARTAEELFTLAPLTSQLPAVDRPLKIALAARFEDGRSLSTRQLLELAARQPQYQQILIEAILSRGARPLVNAMLTAEQNVRQQAAAYLATLGQRGQSAEIAVAIVEALRFEPGAPRVPWDGGALFLPGIAWPKEPATALLGELVAWHLYLDLRGEKNLQRPIDNNLKSLGLANVVGYQMPGRPDTEEWLRIWGRVAGRDAARRVLDEQDAPGRYYQVLERL